MPSQPAFQPYRPVLHVPTDRPRAVARAGELPCGAVVLDLKDAVAPARPQGGGPHRGGPGPAKGGLREGDFSRPVLPRVNGLELGLLTAPDGLVLPKAEDPAAVRELHLGVPLWLTIETPLGVLRAPELAAGPGVAGLMVGGQ